MLLFINDSIEERRSASSDSFLLSSAIEVPWLLEESIWVPFNLIVLDIKACLAAWVRMIRESG